MMQSIRRYGALSADDRSLVIEAAVATILVRLGISVFSFTSLRAALDRVVLAFARVASNTTSGDVRRVAWSVAAVTQRLPFRSTCLIQSLAVDAMLRRRGVRSAIRVGVLPPAGGAVEAHAWVEHEGEVVFGARPDLAEYRVLVPQDAR